MLGFNKGGRKMKFKKIKKDINHNKIEYNKNYAKEHYETVLVYLAMGEKDEVKKKAEKRGLTVSGYFREMFLEDKR